MFRRLGTTLVAAALAAALAACTSTPDPPSTHAGTTPPPPPASAPTPTTTPGAGAADAYLAYLDAVSRVDVADASSVESVLRLSTGTQQRADRDFLNELSAEGWTMSGGSVATRLDLVEATATSAVLVACLDISASHFFDKSGREREPATASKIQPIRVDMTRDNSNVWLVSEIALRTGAPACA